jgi:tight adherence protein B
MRNSADRIGSNHYRLLFTAVEMHRQRGGDVGRTLDSLGQSIREIQRLEGKLDALTAQGRYQARMMGALPALFLAVLYTIEPEGVTLMFTEAAGRIVLLIIGLLMLAGFAWIRKIMNVDI